MKIMTFNMKDDGIFIFSHWKVRLDGFVQLIKKTNPDIIGTQEMTHKAKRRLLTLLDKYHLKYSFYGESRKRHRGWFDEFNTILVKDEIKVLGYATYSLSNTPDVPLSRFPGDKFPRIICFVELDNCYIYNTHLTNKVDDNKFMQLDCISKLIKKDKPIIITGDFNMGITRLKTFCHNNRLIDVTKGVGKTFVTKKYQYHLDHILVSKGIMFHDVLKYTDNYKNRRLSDHYPVSAVIDL